LEVSLDETDQFFMILPEAASPSVGPAVEKPGAGLE